jgi:hypothetical protein
MYGNGIFFLQIQDQTRLAHSQWLCILNATVNVRTNLYDFNFKQNSVVVGSIMSKLPQFVTGETLSDAVQPYCVF